jgi:signal transduction histidine kinase
MLVARERRFWVRPARAWRVFAARVERVVRALPIRWRILSIAVLNTAVVVILGALIWNGAKELNAAWDDVRKVRESDQLLALLENEAGRLQNLIHRYINQPSPDIFAEILLLREALLGTLRTRGSSDPMLSESVDELEQVTERFLDGFGDLRAEQAAITKTYDDEVLATAREMATLYGVVEGAIANRDTPLWPVLSRSREAFTATLVAANSYYLSPASGTADEARRNIATIEQTVPVMIRLAENDIQRSTLRALGERAEKFRDGLGKLADHFANRATMLRISIDGNQAAMIGAIDKLSEDMRKREQQAQARFSMTLSDINRKVIIVAVLFLSIIFFIGFAIGRSIIVPLQQLASAMYAIVSGRYEREIQGTGARDEIGEMARSVEVFRENAIAKRQAEEELRASKERSEQALADLRNAQKSLIESEKLAALGGLVAGVAHEVNNPVGISLTVASSFARRCDVFEQELAAGPIRRSRLDEFIAGSRDAAQQLVANLQRAGELIQSFKQVAVDRSHAERRQFDLREATDQILASLRPVLKKSQISLSVDGPRGIMMDSYPGAFGQVLTNLFLNASVHAFPDGQPGRVIIDVRELGEGDVEIIVADDGVGMSEEVQKHALDPFFTTRRSQGGTGLGLHIIYNIVTQQLGGRLHFDSQPGRGTVFRIRLPRTAPREQFAAIANSLSEVTAWPTATTSSS